MEQFISYIVKNLVDDPAAVRVECRREGDRVSVELRVAPNDVARVIGRRGKTIQALRTIVMSAAARVGYRVRLELIEEGKEPIVVESEGETEEVLADE